jgi:RHS repeat-associated protein
VIKYFPFGGVRSASGTTPTDRRFTGQTQDASVGLYWYQSRFYDARIGRFIQPDSVVPDLNHPQSVNRYAYVLNNPLRYTDPSGHNYDETCNKMPNVPNLCVDDPDENDDDNDEERGQGYTCGVYSDLYCTPIGYGLVRVCLGSVCWIALMIGAFEPPGEGDDGGKDDAFDPSWIDDIAATNHGRQRLIEFEFTRQEYDQTLQHPTRTFRQPDGSTVFIRQRGTDDYDMIVLNADGAVVTAHKYMEADELSQLGQNQAWIDPVTGRLWDGSW